MNYIYFLVNLHGESESYFLENEEKILANGERFEICDKIPNAIEEIDLLCGESGKEIIVFILNNKIDVNISMFPQFSWATINGMDQLKSSFYQSDIKEEAFLSRFRKSFSVIRRNLRDIYHSEVVGQGPLLLPLRNWKEEGVYEVAEKLFKCGMHDTNSLPGYISRFNDIKRNYYKKVRRRPRIYKCSKGRAYKNSLPNERHGRIRVDDDSHPSSCAIQNRFRLGFPIEPEFHFDVQPASKEGQRFTAKYINCHGEEVHHQNVTHVNMWRSDFNKSG